MVGSVTQIPAVMEVSPARSSAADGFTVSRLAAAALVTGGVVALLAVALVSYSLAPCSRTAALIASWSLDSGDGHHDRPYVRLPTSVMPISYEVELVPFIWEGNFTFNGRVTMLANVTRPTDNITMHVNDMQILSHRVSRALDTESDDELVETGEHTLDAERQFLVLWPRRTLPLGLVKVTVSFVGRLNDALQGFYRSSYKVDNVTRWLAATQFQATDARRAFPCMDEPAFKAGFAISIARHRTMAALSNMPRRQLPPQPVDGVPDYEWDRFEQSVPMSTYLVAFVVSDLQHLSDGTFAVWARDSVLGQARYALKIGPRILRHFEDYFGIPFPLPKMDMVALPDFSAGAMENWGLITFREATMLYSDAVSTRRDAHRVAVVVSHELAHQWFGNLVTPSWWTDLWLNEGFASYVEYLGVHSVEPSWRVGDQFAVDELQNAMLLDAMRSSHPVSPRKVDHPAEIDDIFDTISYQKGASIIRMMDHFLSTPVFRRGLTRYLNRRRYGSATRDDLWQALTEQADEEGWGWGGGAVTVAQVMDSWTLQTGFPLVTVDRDYAAKTITISQRRFLVSGGDGEEGDGTLWWVPLSFTHLPQPDFRNTTPSHWLRNQRSTVIDTAAGENHWVLFNVQQTGFYRVNYDERNWRLLIRHLLDPDRTEQIGAVNRAQLLDDALNVARAGVLPYAVALDLTRFLAHERDYLPWRAALNALDYVADMLVKSPGFDRFKAYVLALVGPLYDRVGFVDRASDSQLDGYVRVEALTWACRLGHDACVTNAVTLYHNWRNSPRPDVDNPISANLKGVVYCTAIREGGQPEWEFAWARLQATDVGSEKSLLLRALACSRETWILARYLDRAITEGSGVRRQDAASVFASVSRNIVGQPLVFAFLRDQWLRLNKYFGRHMFVINQIVEAATDCMTTKFELDTLRAFVKEHWREFSTAGKVAQQQIEKTEANIEWMKRSYQPIVHWLSQSS